MDPSKCLHSYVKSTPSSIGILGLHFSIAEDISLYVLPLKGSFPQTKANNIIPIPQISHDGATTSFQFKRTSGGIYFSDPGLSVSVWTP